MREHGLQAPTRVGHSHGPKAHDGTIITEQPDVMWGTDATTTITLEEGQAHVFVGVDHFWVERRRIAQPFVSIHVFYHSRQAVISVLRGVERRFRALPLIAVHHLGREAFSHSTRSHRHRFFYQAIRCHFGL